MGKKPVRKGVPGLNPLDPGASIPDPELRTADILVWIYRNRPDGFTVRDVAAHFRIQHGEAQRRVARYIVASWGAAKAVGVIASHRRGRKEIGYTLTDWGRKYAARRVKG